jgi:alpha-tubulin suppressor-like RCC1 family protein
VKNLSGVTLNSARHEQTCAAAAKNRVWCWGYNQVGLGDEAHTRQSSVPVKISLLAVTALATGAMHACAVQYNGRRVECWGQNGMGQLGDGRQEGEARIPVHPPGMTGVVALSAGATHTCAIKDDGSLWCWGLNAHGQLGYRSPDVGEKPVRVTGF